MQIDMMTAAERYKMLVNHAVQGHWLTIQRSIEPPDDTHEHFLVTCQNCEWFDGWDEPK